MPLKIFNQGARAFRFHNLKLLPGKFTDIPEDKAEEAKKFLLDAYPTELVTDVEAREAAGAKDRRITQLERESAEKSARIAELEGQVARLQAIAGGDAPTGTEAPPEAGAEAPEEKPADAPKPPRRGR